MSGKLAYDEWTDKSGQKRSSYNVIGRIEFLDPPGDDQVESPRLRDRARVQDESLLDPVSH